MTTMRVLELKVYLAVLLAMAGALVLAGPALAHEHVAQPTPAGSGRIGPRLAVSCKRGAERKDYHEVLH